MSLWRNEVSTSALRWGILLNVACAALCGWIAYLCREDIAVSVFAFFIIGGINISALVIQTIELWRRRSEQR